MSPATPGRPSACFARAIEWTRTQRQVFQALGLLPPLRVLLHGPLGCTKTTLARDATNAAGIALLLLGLADVYDIICY